MYYIYKPFALFALFAVWILDRRSRSEGFGELTFQRDGLIMRKRSPREEPFMKLLVFVTEDHVADPTVDALIEQGFRVTRLASTGGFLRKGNTTLLVGIDEAAVERAITIVRGTAPGALVITLELERYERV
jgi:hypothetical protein